MGPKTLSLFLLTASLACFGTPTEGRALPFSLTFVRSFEISFGAATHSEGITVARVDDSATLWITDEGFSRVGGSGLVFNLDPVTGAVVITPGGAPAIFPHPFGPNAEGIAFDTFDTVAPRLFISDTTGSAAAGISAFNLIGGAPVPTSHPFAFLDTHGPSEEPEGIAVHPDTGDIWVADEHDKRIYVFGRDGVLKNSFSVSGLGGISGATGIGPEDLTFFDSDHLLVVDDTPGAPAVHLVPTSGLLADAESFSLCVAPGDPFCVLDNPEGLVFDPVDDLLYLLNAAPLPENCNPAVELCFPTVVVAEVNPTPEPSSTILFALNTIVLTAALRRRRPRARSTRLAR